MIANFALLLKILQRCMFNGNTAMKTEDTKLEKEIKFKICDLARLLRELQRQQGN